MTYLALILSMIILTGCGARGFTKPNATYQEFYKDLMICQTVGQKVYVPDKSTGINISVSNYGNAAASNSNEYLARRSVENHNVRSRNNCMKYKNWEIKRGSDVFHP